MKNKKLTNNLVACFVLFALLLSNYPASRAQASPAGEALPQLLADGQFGLGPNVTGFETVTYLEGLSSPMASLASLLEEKAYYYSINPRVLLTVFEMQDQWVTGAGTGVDLPGADEAGARLDELCLSLSEPFYQRLYAGYGMDAMPGSQELLLADGETVNLSPEQTNAGSYALLAGLAKGLTSKQWAQLISPTDEKGFVATYRRLFPGSDPLDESNRIDPLATPPDDMLKLPFKEGDTWKFTGGPHGWSTGTDTPWSSLDFAPAGRSGCSIPTDRWVAAAADGSIEYYSSYHIRINHGNGWATDYFHLANLRHTSGDIRKNQALGNPSCNGGDANGAHVHFAIVYGGVRQAIDGTVLEGWGVHKGSSPYGGYLTELGAKVYPPNTVKSDITPATTTLALTGKMDHNGAFISSVQVTLSAQDNPNGTGLRYIFYQINDGELINVTYSPVVFTLEEIGTYTLTYYSKDQAANFEITHQEIIQVVNYQVYLPLSTR